MDSLLQRIVVVMVIFIVAACEQIVLDPNDPYENTGPYTVKYKSGSFDTATSSTNIAGTFYYPGGSFADNSRGAVLLTHGFGASYQSYELYANHIASHGFVVFGFNYVETSSDNKIAKHDDKAVQLKEAITFVLSHPDFSSVIDPGNIALMGHSMGGKISFMTASSDNRVTTVIGLDPSNAGGPPCLISPSNCANYPAAPNPSRGQVGIISNISSASSLIFRSNPDLTNPAEEFNAFYFFFGDDNAGNNAVPAPAYYIDFGGFASHASYLPNIVSNTTPIVKRTTVAWLKYQFEGVDTTDYLSGTVIQADITQKRIARVLTRL